jgi:hypothetical protein
MRTPVTPVRARPSSIAFAPGVLLLAAALGAVVRGEEPAAPQKACKDCHSGQDKNAPVVTRDLDLAHGGTECQDCHTGVKLPCKKNMPPTDCADCHKDEMNAMMGSTHGEKTAAMLKKQGKTRASDLCLPCHADDPHNMRSPRDPKSPCFRRNVPATCMQCHECEQPPISAAYLQSAHGAALAKGNLESASCAECHGHHAIDNSLRATSPMYRGSVPETCGICHKTVREKYEASVHWAAAKKGFRDAPVCTDCHGEHGIKDTDDPAARVSAGNVAETCSRCHAAETMNRKFSLSTDRVESFKDSYHGLFIAWGNVKAANCASCHGAHKILPSSDPQSPVHPANLGATCGRCHPGAETRLAGVKIHTTTARPAHWSVGLVRRIYIWAIGCFVAVALVHHLFDLRSKVKQRVAYRRANELTPRLTVNERVQHILLMVAFALLAWTGFALRNPEAFYAQPFHWFTAAGVVRRWVHLGSAAAFVALALYHVAYMLGSARGRAQFKALRPTLRDWRDVGGVVRKWLNPARPAVELAHYGYMEKMEYWACVWGFGVMTASGLMLVFVNAVLSRLPLWTVELAATIHYWEAVLALVAVVVWHFYWAVFDPDVYPLNQSWLSGQPHTQTESAAIEDAGAK